MHHLRKSQKRWAAGDCPSLPLEVSCPGSRGRPQCCDEAAGRGQRLRMLGCTVSMKSDMEPTMAKVSYGSRRDKWALCTSPGPIMKMVKFQS